MLAALTNIRLTKVLWWVEDDDLWWKMTFCGRLPSMEDDLLLVGRRPLLEEDFRWKTTFGGGRPSVADDLGWKMTLGGKQPLVEDDLQW